MFVIWPACLGYFSCSDSGTVSILLASLQQCPKWISWDYCPRSLCLSPISPTSATPGGLSPHFFPLSIFSIFVHLSSLCSISSFYLHLLPLLRTPPSYPTHPLLPKNNTFQTCRSPPTVKILKAFSRQLFFMKLLHLSHVSISSVVPRLSTPAAPPFPPPPTTTTAPISPNSSDNLVILTWPDYCHANLTITSIVWKYFYWSVCILRDCVEGAEAHRGFIISYLTNADNKETFDQTLMISGHFFYQS